MTTRAAGFIGLGTDTEIVDGKCALSNLGVRGTAPCPVEGMHDLLGRIRVARQARFGNFWRSLEILLEDFELGVVCRG